MKTQAILIQNPGGPEALAIGETSVPEPGPGDLLIRHEAIAVNYIDVYHRSGLYPVTNMPFTPGLEGAGVIAAKGESVPDFEVGQRVAYASPPLGSYAAMRIMPADRIVPLPDSIDFETAAASMTKGMTAEYLLRRAYPVQKGDTILVHAAAGGVGLILCQWAKRLGATVIGTVSTKDKADLAKQNGCDYPFIYTQDDFLAKVMEVTDGQGVPVVYDSVGKDTFEKSLDCLRPRGMMVSFGNASGPIPAFEPGLLAQKGSLFFTRPSLMHYTANRAELLESAQALFDVIESGAVKISVNHRYALKDAHQAHKDLEARKTTGSIVLRP